VILDDRTFFDRLPNPGKRLVVWRVPSRLRDMQIWESTGASGAS
jgi:hypothetical protein